MSKLMKWLLFLAVCAGCAGDGSTLGPDGRPASDEVVEDDGGNDVDDPGDAGDVDAPTTEITLAQISGQIFAPNCAFSGCHGGGSPQANMSLEAEFVAGEIIGIASTERPEFKRIDPGNPDDSYLLMKLRGDSRITGGQMPLGGGTLPAELLEMVREWIAGGAPIE